MSRSFITLLKTLCAKTKKKIFSCHFQTGGAFEGVVDDVISPFGYKRGEGIDAGFGEHDWICDRDRERTDTIFDSLNPIDGKITGAGMLTLNQFHILSDFDCLFYFIISAAKTQLIKSKLPNSVLSKIWKLADYNADGKNKLNFN